MTLYDAIAMLTQVELALAHGHLAQARVVIDDSLNTLEAYLQIQAAERMAALDAQFRKE